MVEKGAHGGEEVNCNNSRNATPRNPKKHLDKSKKAWYNAGKGSDLTERTFFAGMAELADAQDLGSCAARRAGSTPVTRTSR